MDNDILIQESIMFACLTALVGFVLWLLFRRRQVIMNLEYHRLETLNKLIDKYGSAAEFISFMATDAGKRLLITAEKEAPASNGKNMVLRFIQAAVMIFVLGAGFLAGSSEYGDSTDLGNIQRAHDMEYWGVMCFMLSFGLGIVSMVTYGWHKTQERAARKARKLEAA